MSTNSSIEKKAMSSEEKMKYVKAAILAGTASAGIGAIVRNVRSKKKREKAMDASKARNAIVIPVKKTKFMEGLPTPKELAESRGETSVEAPAQLPAPETASLPDSVPSATPTPSDLTPEEIAAKKKEILRNNARRVDFFGKRGSAKIAQEESKKEEGKGEGSKEDGEKKEERQLFRDQDGKFVSPTDPIAVAQQEKDAAIEGILDSIIHPIDSVGKVWNAATDKPVWFTAGALGSIYLATKISDMINEHRREKAKNRLDQARSEYVDLLEGGEKTAADWRDTSGAVLGSALFVPMAVTALVTNRIIENRKLEKKKQKEMSDSYPDDPIILYKTSEAKEIPMSATTFLAVMAVNREIMKCAEAECRSFGLCKTAQAADKGVVDAMTGMMSDPANNALMLDLTRAYYSNDAAKQKQAIEGMVKRYATGAGISDIDALQRGELGKNSPMDMRKWDMDKVALLGKMWQASQDPQQLAALKSSIMTDPRTRATFVDKFNNDPEFGKFKNEIINKELANSWVGRTFKQDGILYRGIQWLLNKFGYGNKQFNERLNGLFSAKPNAETTPNAVPASAPAATSATTPTATPAKATPIQPPSANDPKYGGPNGIKQWNEDFAAFRNQGKQD